MLVISAFFSISEEEQVDEVPLDDLMPNVPEITKENLAPLKENEHQTSEKRNEDKSEITESNKDNKDSLGMADDLMKLNANETDEYKKETRQGTEFTALKSEDGDGNILKDSIDKSLERIDDVNDDGILESFKDWKEKQETTVKKNIIQDNSIPVAVLRTRLNKKTNYASNECGAKVVAANPEAENTAAILNENMDMYMLNPCSVNIWFVVELCEKIQAETVDIANFELFSSTPETFKVFFSSRYPTREWQLVGSFNSRSERVIQSFHLEEKLYAKFVKVEICYSLFGTFQFIC